MIKNWIITMVLLAGSTFCTAQDINKLINAGEADRIVRILSADDMQGRATFTPGIDKAAAFIAGEFAKSKLKFLNGSKSYMQEFALVKTKVLSLTGMLDADSLNESNCIPVTSRENLNITSLAGWETVVIDSAADFFKVIRPLLDKEQNQLILVHPSQLQKFKRMKSFMNRSRFAAVHSMLLVLTSSTKPATLSLQVKNELTTQKLKNVVAVLPGKSRKDEYVVFSGHYDHLGIGKPSKEQDSIYNGANDDAAGTAAVIMLAKYFSTLKEKNERTLIFAAFTAEERGGFGSQYFSRQLNPDKVMAMFNIEMIGTESKWGPNSAYITGFDKSDMGKILQAGLKGSKFTFEPDPYPQQNLFYRSDNATLAMLGVPAHTISTSKMDTEKYYHTVDDEIETLNMTNMAEIIKAIALSSKTIISGKETPTRVAKEN